jgi:serine protease Do
LSTTSSDAGSSTVSTATTVNGSIIATDVSDIVENAMPCIVAITNMTETEYRTWFGQSYTQEEDYAGSGIIVSEDDDYLYIATNNHVVDGATTITVQFCDDSTVTAEVKGTSATNDLAVVMVAKDDIEDSTKEQIKIAKINDDGNEKVGEPVIAIGNALGYGQSVTSGIISALNREVSAEDSSTGETYASTVTQTDASINPGNSGGALLNIKGEVIGINSSKMGGDYVDGVGFAIPMTTAAPIINELITRSKVTDEKAGFLGINGYDVDDTVSATYNMPSGIYVAKVYEDSAAAEAGIQQGDIITEFDGREVSSMEELQEMLQYREAGTTVKLTINRTNNGQYEEIEVEVTLGSKN